MSKKPVKLTKDERRDAALKIALVLAKKCGAKRVSLAAVAAKMGVTPPLLFHIFKAHAEFVKQLTSYARKQAVALPTPAPTVRELRARAPAKVAALLKPVKATAAPMKATKPAALPIKVAAKKQAAPVAAKRKPLTPAQKAAKAKRDAARRAPAAPTTPAGKYAALPKPFEAAMQQVAP